MYSANIYPYCGVLYKNMADINTRNANGQIIEEPVLVTDKLTVYMSEIQELERNYIDNLPKPELIFKSNCFNGLLQYIYMRLLCKAGIKDDDNRINYNILEKVFFDLYIPLTAKYGIVPTIIGFCDLCKISNQYLAEVRDGVTRSGELVSNEASTIVKKLYTTTENGLVSRVANESSIGSMFLLKCKYDGYVEQQHLVINTTTNVTENTDSILERHNIDALTMPEKPDLFV